MWRGSAEWRTVTRDVLLLVLPGGAFIWEVAKDKPSVELLILYMALLTVPGLAGTIFLARHGGGGGTVPPPLPPQQPPAVPPASSSPSSSPGAEG